MSRKKYDLNTRLKYLMALAVIVFAALLLLIGISFNSDPESSAMLLRASFALALLSTVLLPLVFLFFISLPLRDNLEQSRRYLSVGRLDEAPPELMDRGFEKLLEEAIILTTSRNNAIMMKQQAEISALQSQINPHFLYNTLEAIRSEALLADQLIIAEMTEALSAFFRYSISYKSPIVPLTSELDNVRDYLSIQMYRFQDKIDYSINVDDPKEKIMQSVLPIMTLQPIIENSIYHGLEMKIGQGKIDINISSTEKRLIIHIVDNGIGMDNEQLQEIRNRLYRNILPANKRGHRSGLAILNVNRRLKLFFGEEYGIQVFSTRDIGTDVELTLPLLSYNQLNEQQRKYIDEEYTLEARSTET